MKPGFCTIALFALMILGIGVNASASDNDPKILIKREKDYFDAIIKRDYKTVNAILAENYFATYALGIIDKTREMKDVREFPLASYEITEPKVEFPSPKIGIISFKLHVKVIVDGKEFFEDDFLTCVWIKDKKKWLMLSQTAVKAAKDGN